jgi:arylsulfatase A-like enzyme
MIWWGKGIRKGKNRIAVDAIDMVPTVFEILGLDQPYPTEGRIIGEILE